MRVTYFINRTPTKTCCFLARRPKCAAVLFPMADAYRRGKNKGLARQGHVGPMAAVCRLNVHNPRFKPRFIKVATSRVRNPASQPAAGLDHLLMCVHIEPFGPQSNAPNSSSSVK